MIAPLAGAAVVPEYVAPIASPPSTSNLLAGVVVPTPTFPSMIAPLAGAAVVPE